MRFKLISCDVLYREMCAVVARSRHQVDFDFLPKGLHDRKSAEMLHEIQAKVDGVDPGIYQGVLLGYGLCGNGLAGLTARAIPVVLPRAHDCITLFLGDRHRYMEYFNSHPGVYFKTTGWIERGEGTEISQLALRKYGYGMTRAELAAKYGEENADFLANELENYKVTYSQFTFIEMGVEPDDHFERRTVEEAVKRGWNFEKIRGNMSLIEGLVNGDWDEQRYLVVQPGFRVVARYDDGIISAERAV